LFGVVIEADTARERKRLADALNALARFSLATVDDDTVGVHRLLQKVIRDDVAGRDDRRAALHALAAVAAAFPSDVELPAHWPLCERLLPHVLTFADTVPESGDSATQLVDLLNHTWWYLTYVGTHRQRLALAQRAFGHAERLLGTEHSLTLRTRNILALSDYYGARDGEDPLTTFEPLITDAARILGAEHAFTLGMRGNLANAYHNTGRPDEAIAILEPLLAEYERILGPEHLGTLLNRSNLAHAYKAAGRIEDALATYEPLLADHERILGPEHPQTLYARSGLAGTYQNTGRIEDALAIFEPLLADYERILGPEHPSTLDARSDLASAYDAAGRTADAERVREPPGPAETEDWPRRLRRRAPRSPSA
jgi:tetratricopeptide (TPR) repeat protein